MYVPVHFAAGDAVIDELLDGHGAADLVTVTTQGLVATMLPFIYVPGDGTRGALHGHVARNNPQWKLAPTGDAMIIVHGPDAYISPSWYPSKAEHGRVVPTWNYVIAHIYGQLVVHDDPEWVQDVVHRLTVKHEADTIHPWSVEDAPPEFIAGQLRAIVGIELVISRIEAKAKLSQNRPAADIDGVIGGLRSRGDDCSADAVARVRPDASTRSRPAKP
ncbi:FMN-binding negative transcriptional regulator [Mycobacterium sp. MUNTM1]